jgi:hypothetical protein
VIANGFSCSIVLIRMTSSFRLKQTVNYTEPNPGVGVKVMPIEPTGTNIGMVVHPSSVST